MIISRFIVRYRRFGPGKRKEHRNGKEKKEKGVLVDLGFLLHYWCFVSLCFGFGL